METAINQRVMEFYNSTGYKSVRLWAKELDIPYTTLSEFLRGSEPRYSTIKAILDGNPYLSAEWLMRGTGEMLLKEKADNPSSEKDELEKIKAELNQMMGENRLLREQLGLPQRKEVPGKSA